MFSLKIQTWNSNLNSWNRATQMNSVHRRGIFSLTHECTRPKSTTIGGWEIFSSNSSFFNFIIRFTKRFFKPWILTVQLVEILEFAFILKNYQNRWSLWCKRLYIDKDRQTAAENNRSLRSALSSALRKKFWSRHCITCLFCSDTKRKWVLLDTNAAFLSSHKRTPLLSWHFFWSWECPCMGRSTVVFNSLYYWFLFHFVCMKLH